MNEKCSDVQGQQIVRKPLLSLDDTDEEGESVTVQEPEIKHKSSMISLDLNSTYAIENNNSNADQAFVTIIQSSSQQSCLDDKDNRASEHLQPTAKPVPMKLISALFYGISSLLISVINKIVLTTYKFPSFPFLGIGQMVAIIVILGAARQLKVIKFPRLTLQKLNKIWVLSLLYLANLITGLGSTKHLSLPMMIALRRFSIAMTAIGEFYILKVRQSLTIIMTIVAMIGGSLIAASADPSFNARGYLLVMTNNFCTAGNGVYMKKVLVAKDIDKYELLYYNALLTILPLSIICFLSTDLSTIIAFNHWSNIGFLSSFLLSCIMGFLLMQSTMLCTYYNSPLTTTIVGTLKVSSANLLLDAINITITSDNRYIYSDSKRNPPTKFFSHVAYRYKQNILSTYIGMYIGGDYQFTVLNFLGLNVSLVGSLVYSYLTFVQKSKKQASATC